MQERLWTISNCLSMLRVLLIIPVTLLLLADTPAHRLAAIGIMAVMILTDYFDGWLARKLGQVTRIGKIIDPVADKLCLGVVAIVMVVQGEMPLWFLVVLVSRDLLILAGAAYIDHTRNLTLVSNRTGKWAVFIISLYVLACLYPVPSLEPLQEILMILSLIMIVVSSVLYASRLVRILHSSPAVSDRHAAG